MGLLAFSSDGSNQGTGFRINIRTRALQISHSPVFHLDESSGVFRYPAAGNGNYRNDVTVLAVFQLNQPNFLELTSLITEATYDPVSFFTIPHFKSHGNATLDGK